MNFLPRPLFQLAVIALGIAMTWVGIAGRKAANAQKAWPTAEATILSFEMLYSNEHEPELKVTCRYQVDDVTVESNLYTENYGDPATVAARYGAGTTMLVYYDPEYPPTILLKPGDHLAWWGPLGAGIFLVLFAGWFFVLHTASDVLMWVAMRRAKRQFRELDQAIDEMRAVIDEMRNEYGDRPPADVADQIRTMESRVEEERLKAAELRASIYQDTNDP